MGKKMEWNFLRSHLSSDLEAKGASCGRHRGEEGAPIHRLLDPKGNPKPELQEWPVEELGPEGKADGGSLRGDRGPTCEQSDQQKEFHLE